MNILERFESVAQSYVRTAPVVFDKALGSVLFDEAGNRYIDFYAAGGSLSYGHNCSAVRDGLIKYLSDDRVLQTSDRTSAAKRRFVEAFVQTILQPRKMDYKILFTDPASGTAAELALRLARRNKNRTNVVAFTNSSHGMTEGSLAVTGRQPTRSELLTLRSNTAFMPFCGYFGDDFDTIAYFRRYLEDSASGLDLPAAVIVETVQVHGGIHVASDKWLRALEQLSREFGFLLIVDETLTGCGRLGPYFSFERSGIRPDMVLASNAIAGGLPMCMLLLKPELDQWRPGEQAGMFQGDSLAFVAATELLPQSAAQNLAFMLRGEILADRLLKLVERFPHRRIKVRGTGMLWGVDFGRPGSAAVVSAWALEQGVIVEPARSRDDVLLIVPPLTIEEPVLLEGLDRLDRVLTMFLSHG